MSIHKYRIYIDEVGNNDLNTSDEPNHRYLSLTGLVLEFNYVKNVVHDELEKLKQKYFSSHPDEPVILHRKELVNKKYPFNSLKNPEVEKAFNEELINFLDKLDVVIMSVLLDKKQLREKYRVWRDDPYRYCMEILIERFFYFLESKDSCGDVMVESRGKNEDKRLKNSFSRIYENGTKYIEPLKLQTRLSSKELKVKPKSSNIAGLQICDLIAHPSRRFMFEFYGTYKDNSNPFGDKIIEAIKKKYFKDIAGEIDGYGIKFLP